MSLLLLVPKYNHQVKVKVESEYKNQQNQKMNKKSHPDAINSLQDDKTVVYYTGCGHL